MSFLEQNLIGISSYNKILADKIRSHVLNTNIEIQFIQCPSGDVTLSYNGILLHDGQNPQQEAMNEFQRTAVEKGNKLLIQIGLGLGYLLKRHFISSESKVIVYEPNMDILRLTLEAVDFSQEILSDRVAIANSIPELTSLVHQKCAYKDKISATKLSSADILYPDEISKLKEVLPNLASQLNANFACLFEYSSRWLAEGLKNMPDYAKSFNINALHNKFKGKTALVLSPGPSLEKNIEVIKENRDKFIIFCVNVAYKKLALEGIIPDFTVIIDNNNVIYSIIEQDLTKTNLIAQSSVFHEIFGVPVNKKFVFYSENELMSRWLSKAAGFSLNGFSNKGTVSYCALYSAYILGCNPIILVGQDLAYTDGKCYASGSAYGDLYKVKTDEEGKMKIARDDNADTSSLSSQMASAKNLQNDNLAYVRGQDGNMLPTFPHYAGFIQYFEEFAYQVSGSDLKLYNSSTGGAQINGYENKPLEQIVQGLYANSISVNDEIEKVLVDYKEPIKEKYSLIQGRFSQLLGDIDKFMPIINEGLELSEKVKKEANRCHPDISKMGKQLKTVLNYYGDVSDNLINKNEILMNIVFKELLEVSVIIGDQNRPIDIEFFKEMGKVTNDFFFGCKSGLVEFKQDVKTNVFEAQNGVSV